jgi:hypothetical protein
VCDKVLRIRYAIQSLDKHGSATDMTPSGHRKNFIIPKKGDILRQVGAARCDVTPAA